MSKKIIAVSLIMVLMVTCLVACKRDYPTVIVDGKEYVVSTDKNGDVILDKNGDYIVYLTDVKGNFLKDSEGERQTNKVEKPNSDKGKTETGYIMTAPKGWTFDETTGNIVNDENKDICLQVAKFENQDVENIDEYLAVLSKKEANLITELMKAYPDSTKETFETQITEKNIPAKGMSYKFVDSEGNVVLYSWSLYFMSGRDVYKLYCGCFNNSYDENIDIEALFEENFKLL